MDFIRNRAILVGTVCTIAISAGVWAFTRNGAQEAIQYKTAVAETRDLRYTVSATGIVQPFTVVDIKSRAGGEIVLLSVDVGDRVKKGQLIARIDPTDSQTAYDQASADVSAAQARVTQAQQTLALQQKTTVTSIQDAEARLRSAEAQVRAAESRLSQARQQSAAQPALTDAAIKQAKASLLSAEKQLVQLKDATDPQARQQARSDLASAQAGLRSAKANLTNSELNLKRQKGLADSGFVARSTVDTAEAQVEASRSAVASAEAQVASAGTRMETVGNSQEAAIAAAEARVTEAKQALRSAETNRVQIGLRSEDVKNAEASLSQAKANLTQAQVALETARANRMQVAIRGNDITTAQAQIARAAATQNNTKIVLGQTVIRAPADGVVLQKYVEQGTIIASGSAFSSASGQGIVQLGDLSRVFVDAQVDETDISRVKVGQRVTVDFDAVPDTPFKGRVTRIEPRGVTDNNITTVKARIELEQPSPALRPGLNGECEFLIDEKPNVLVIPSRAIRNEGGKKIVQVLTGDEKNPVVEKREIKVGMETMEAVEVVSGLKPGEKVVTAAITPGKGGAGGPKPGEGGNAMGGLAGRR